MISNYLVAQVSDTGVVSHALTQLPGKSFLALGIVPPKGMPLIFSEHVRFSESASCEKYFCAVEQGLHAGLLDHGPAVIWAVHREPVVAPLRASFRKRGLPYTQADGMVKCIIDDLIAPTPWDIERRKNVRPEHLEVLLRGASPVTDDISLMMDIPPAAKEFFSYLRVLKDFLS